MGRKQKETVTFIGRHGIEYERYADDPLVSCKYIIDPYEEPTVHYGFGDVFKYNSKAEIYTIIEDGGNIVQRGVGQVIFPENKVVKDEVST